MTDNIFEVTELEVEEMDWTDEITDAPTEVDMSDIDEFPDWLE